VNSRLSFYLLLIVLPVTTACTQNHPMELRNHLASEKSPYLLQHKDNPVNWFAWGEPAFEVAKKLDRPIFLSIGYSTCHWCHVMEHESFEDDSVAVLLNESMISIKVDREERPDIDNLYMTVCQMMGGSCGWPLNVLITPDKKPFFATTYIPKESRFGRIGMLDLIPRIADAWSQKREDVLKSAEDISAAVSGAVNPNNDPQDLQTEILDRAFTDFSGRFDPQNGGFSGAPKFPSPHNLLFLLRYAVRTGNQSATRMVSRTLEHMRAGGIYDHVGFGFHRYSTDSTWTVPHFEKMLYDQAMLTLAYTEAYQVTREPLFARTTKEILAYVSRDMSDPEGGFYSAEDADSEGEEGLFYLWTDEEIRTVLGTDAGGVEAMFHVSAEGNFRDEATHAVTGRNILYRAVPDSNEDASWEADRKRLFTEREKRIHPGKDDKVLTDWNGLMIAAYSKAAAVLADDDLLDRAGRAADFLLSTMVGPDGRLLHRWRDSEAGIEATASDYVFLTWGLIELYEAGFDTRYLEEAIRLTQILHEDFEDNNGGGLFITSHDGEALIARQKETYDGAIPSSNSVAMMNLLRLSRFTGNTELEGRAAAIVRFMSASVSRAPTAYTAFLSGLDMAFGPSFEVVISGSPGAPDTEKMVRALRKEYIPSKVIVFRDATATDPAITTIAPFTRTQRAIDGKATAYVCRNFVCNLPTTDPVVMLDHLNHPDRIGAGR